MIEVSHLTKSFGEVKAVQDVSFAAPNGLITGLLGPNGAGKSSSMRLIAGILKPDSGQATIDGYDVHRQTLAAQSRLGILPDKHGLYQRLTSRENVEYYGRLRGLSGGELDNNINRLFQLLEMDDIADRRCEGFSTGQRVKVAIARALVHQPQNVMLDEPTVGLDVMSTRTMRSLSAACATRENVSSFPATSCRRWRCCATISSSSLTAKSLFKARPTTCARLPAMIIWKTLLCRPLVQRRG
jgi:sodium transport system ATP-binding protein